MKWHKISALLYLDSRVLARAKWKLAEYFYFPITTIIIWGLFSLYANQFAVEAGLIVLIVNVYWNFSLVAQSSVNQSMNVDNWSGSLKQILMSGISAFEYITARMLFSLLISTILFTILGAMSIWFFGFTQLLAQPLTYIALAGISLLSSMALSLLVAGAKIIVGREYDFFAWTALQFFILFSAPFFPREVLPPVMYELSTIMPFTYIFESIRTLIATGTLPFSLLLTSLVVSVAYFLMMIPFYHYSFKRGRKTGELVRMD